MDIRNFFGSPKGKTPSSKTKKSTTTTKPTTKKNTTKAKDVKTKNPSSSSKTNSTCTKDIKKEASLSSSDDTNNIHTDKFDVVKKEDKDETVFEIKSSSGVSTNSVGKRTTKAISSPTQKQHNSATKRKHSKKISIKEEDDYDDEDDDVFEDDNNFDDYDEDDDFEKPMKKTNPKKASTSPSKKRKTTTSSTSKSKSNSNNNKPKKILIQPTSSIPSYPHSQINNKLLFTNTAFVITGVLPNISREELTDYIKILGGRVTTAVSSKTNYLVVGEQLEDGRNIESGSKYKKAMALGESSIRILNGEGEVYALAKMLDGDSSSSSNDGGNDNDNGRNNGESGGNVKEEKRPVMVTNPYAKKSTTVTNPYAKSTTTVKNPYAKASSTSTETAVRNPYAKIPCTLSGINNTSSESSSCTNASSSMGGGRASMNDANALWADKYAPSSTNMILGNGTNVKKLKIWLSQWEDNFLKPLPKGKKRQFNPKTGPFKAALLSGPPGIGKTTTAVLVAKEARRQVLELNASDTRSKKSLETNLGDVTGSHVLSFENNGGKHNQIKRCIIMDEVDGMGAGDRSGMSELIKMIKKSLVPIICICNDRQSQKIKSLVPHCLDLKYSRPVKSVIAKRAMQIGEMEGMRVEYNAAEAIAESCGNDIRQVLNCLQMWSSKKSTDMTYKDYKERNNLVNKDEILRVSLFDATRLIIEGRRGLTAESDPKAQNSHLYKRTDAFFVDYSLMGLMVHQNYLKISGQKYAKTKTSGDMDAELQCMKDLYEGTKCMSDFAVAEESLRVEQNWTILPLCSVLVVKSGYHTGGEGGGMLGGFPEFSGWLGKNSSRGKKNRLIQELAHHMNYKISADNTELRLGYLPAIRNHLSKLLHSKEDSQVTEAIDFMDEYGLDRDDVFENMDEFLMGHQQVKKFSDLDSKSKAAFTREYNKGIHKSQALVDEQGVSTRKRKAIKESENSEDEDYGDEEEEEEVDVEELAKAFQKKKKAAAKSTTKRGKKVKN